MLGLATVLDHRDRRRVHKVLILLLALSEDQVGVGLRGTAHATLLSGGGERAVSVIVLNSWHGLVARHSRLAV